MNGFVVLIAVLAVIVVAGGMVLVATANRLDRLHVRRDAGWAALDAALARRAVVARAIAGVLSGEHAAGLHAAAETAETAPRSEREGAENELTRLLAEVDRARLPPTLADELTDAQHRLMIARRVHNDAVRDTLTLRRRRKVRYFGLAGTAPLPEYFEIAEPDLDTDRGAPQPRVSARVVLLGPDRRVLLFQGHDPGRPGSSFWFTVGGGVRRHEDMRDAARRELHEETGVELGADGLTGPVWRRRVEFSFEGKDYDGDEWFFLARASTVDIDVSGFTELEKATIDGHRWWSVPELCDTKEIVYPEQLGELLPAVLDGKWDGELRAIR